MELKEKSIFSKNLISARKQKGISQRDLSKLSGISNRVIAYYETHSTIPPMEKLKKIAEALNVPIAKLIDPTLSDKKILQLNTRTLKKVKLLEQLSQKDQQKVLEYIKDLLAKNKNLQDSA
jgi:transcriptional regulator with XRE-family HTH domain